MAFRTKNFAQISSGMISRMRGATTKITDFQVGSVARTLVEGPASELDKFYQRVFIGLREAIPVATFESFGFAALPSATASGMLTVSRLVAPGSDRLIPAGTVFSALDGRKYKSVTDVVWAGNALSVNLRIEGELPGASWNANAGVIASSQLFTNNETFSSAPITGGRDDETQAEREARFADYIAALSRGTVDAIRYGASQARVEAGGVITEYVTRVGIDEHPGWVRLYIYSSRGAPSVSLLDNGQRLIDGYRDDFGAAVPGYRPAGVRVDVLPMIEVPVNFAADVTMFNGFDFDTATRNAMLDVFTGYVNSIQAGETLFIGTLVEKLLLVDGVRQVVPENNANIACEQYQVLVPGDFTLTEA